MIHGPMVLFRELMFSSLEEYSEVVLQSGAE